MKWFTNLRVAKKILAVVWLLALCLGGVTYQGVNGMARIHAGVSSMHDKQVAPLSDILQIVNGFQRTRVLIRDIILATDQTERTEYMMRIDEIVQANEELNLRYEASIVTDDGRKAFEEYKASLLAHA